MFESYLHLKNVLFFIYESFANLPLFHSSTFQTKRTATAGGARGISLYEDEASCVDFTSIFKFIKEDHSNKISFPTEM